MFLFSLQKRNRSFSYYHRAQKKVSKATVSQTEGVSQLVPFPCCFPVDLYLLHFDIHTFLWHPFREIMYQIGPICRIRNSHKFSLNILPVILKLCPLIPTFLPAVTFSSLIKHTMVSNLHVTSSALLVHRDVSFTIVENLPNSLIKALT